MVNSKYTVYATVPTVGGSRLVSIKIDTKLGRLLGRTCAVAARTRGYVMPSSPSFSPSALPTFDLRGAARRAMIHTGFAPHATAAVRAEVARAGSPAWVTDTSRARDLRQL